MKFDDIDKSPGCSGVTQWAAAKTSDREWVRNDSESDQLVVRYANFISSQPRF